MFMATTIGVVLIPVLYVFMQILRERLKGQYKGSDVAGNPEDHSASGQGEKAQQAQ